MISVFPVLFPFIISVISVMIAAVDVVTKEAAPLDTHEYVDGDSSLFTCTSSFLALLISVPISSIVSLVAKHPALSSSTRL